MNKKYQLQRERAGQFTGVTHAMMALLFVLGVGQMALCFSSAVKLVPNRPQLVASTVSALAQTNSSAAHGVTPASTHKI